MKNEDLLHEANDDLQRYIKSNGMTYDQYTLELLFNMKSQVEVIHEAYIPEEKQEEKIIKNN
jgi:hypothetical protein